MTEHYADLLFELPDGRLICVSIMDDGRYRLMEKDSPDGRWSAPVEGRVA